MRIDSSNASIINTKEVYLHDAYITQFEVFLSERRIVISIDPYREYSNITKMTFNNVVGAKTTLFEVFAECDGRILDFYKLNESDTKLIKELYTDSENEKKTITSRNDKGEIIESNSTSNIDSMERLMELEFFLDSADRLTIVCESLDIETEDTDGN